MLRDFWATEAALGVTMFSNSVTSVLRHVVMRQKVHHTLSTLHHQVLAVGAMWDDSTKNTKQTLRLAVARKRRPWFEGLWANAGEPVKLTPVPCRRFMTVYIKLLTPPNFHLVVTPPFGSIYFTNELFQHLSICCEDTRQQVVDGNGEVCPRCKVSNCHQVAGDQGLQCGA